jgi:hypothetical protein
MDSASPGGDARHLIRKLKLNTARKTAEGFGGARNTETVYYLYGDERRAVRVFIESNYEYLREIQNDSLRGHPILQSWGDGMAELYREEWDFFAENGFEILDPEDDSHE